MDPARSAQMLTLTLASAVYDVLAETGKMKIPVQRGSGPVFFYKRTQKYTFQIRGRNNGRREAGWEALNRPVLVGGGPGSATKTARKCHLRVLHALFN